MIMTWMQHKVLLLLSGMDGEAGLTEIVTATDFTRTSIRGYLRTLEHDGRVASHVEQRGGRKRLMFRITLQGRQDLAMDLRTPGWIGRHPKFLYPIPVPDERHHQVMAERGHA